MSTSYRFMTKRGVPVPSVRVTQTDPMRRVRVGDVLIPRRFTVRIYEDEHGSPDVEHIYEVRKGVPECREVHILATEDGHEVRVSGLAGIRVQDVLELAIREMALGPVTRLDLRHFRISAISGPEQRSNAVRQVNKSRSALKIKVTDAMLRRVAEVYRADVNGRPTEAVAEAFDTTHRTAGRYIQRARAAGHLGAAIKGRAGER